MSDVQDIKKLMKQHIKTSNANNKKEIDSPYAKYNSRGQLMCIVCGTIVKSKIIWQAHIIKRSHKENLEKLIEKQKEISNLQHRTTNSQAEKRLASESELPTGKKKQCVNKPKGILKNFSSYGSSDEESEEEQQALSDDIKPPSLPPVKKEVESDFVDDSLKISKALDNRLNNNAEEGETSALKKEQALPEGFFDDPVADAKARRVEYVDKEEEEWLTFMKEVSAAEVQSKQIIAEDKEEAAIETQMEQVSEQIRYFERVVEIDRAKKNQTTDDPMNCDQSNDEESSDEEFSTVIWRTKSSSI